MGVVNWSFKNLMFNSIFHILCVIFFGRKRGSVGKANACGLPSSATSLIATLKAG